MLRYDTFGDEAILAVFVISIGVIYGLYRSSNKDAFSDGVVHGMLIAGTIIICWAVFWMAVRYLNWIPRWQ